MRTNIACGLCAALLSGGAARPAPAAAAPAPPPGWAVKSAAEQGGKLRIALRDGRVFTLNRAPGQCAFDNIQIAPDGVTIAWAEGGTAEAPEEPPSRSDEQYVASGPIVWRAGRILRRFDAWGAEVNFQFRGKGDQIAIHAGPAHFDDDQAATLYDVATGRALKSWSHAEKTDPPDWAAGVIDY
jgi:hypothetical protein